MDFFKGMKFKKAKKSGLENDIEEKPVPQPEEPRNENGDFNGKSDNIDPAAEVEDDDDDDDDFITNEVKRRLKELRRNSFMVLIPEEEESCGVEEEDDEEGEGEMRSTEWRDIEAEGRRWWGGFDAVYEKYCERMLFFDQMSTQQLNEVANFGCYTPGSTPSTPSPRSASKKLTSPFSCLSLKKTEEPEDENEHLQQLQNNPYQDIETAYVAQVCLTWEVLHCQYTQLCQKISTQQEFQACYNNSAQQLQQFQVLLQRFIENEPFEQGLRVEIYARVRNFLPKLLQFPNLKGTVQKEAEAESDSMLLASDLIRILESSILTFQLFVKSDKKKLSGVRNLFGNQNQTATPLHLIQSSFEKKRSKLKELSKKRKGWKKKSWPQTLEDVEVLFGLIDIKLISRVLRMLKITKEQLIWCEEKLKKLDITNGNLVRDPTPILFPC